jgi:hypothetical protein
MCSEEIPVAGARRTFLQRFAPFLDAVTAACAPSLFVYFANGCSSAAQPMPTTASPAPAVESSSEASVGPGCHSGVRVGFADANTYPKIAACAGGWDEPGLISPKPVEGNAAALCADGWHICTDIAEVKRTTNGVGCAGAGLKDGAFFAIQDGAFEPPECFTRGSIGVLGCGSLGAPAPQACAPLERVSNPGCSALVEPWACEKNTEVWSLTKPKHEAGGVLCCEGKASAPTPATKPWDFAAGAPFGGNGDAGCASVTLSTTNTEPWGDGAFRNTPDGGPAVVIVTFAGRVKGFHLSATLSGRKAYLQGFNVAPTGVSGRADFDGQRVQTPNGVPESTVMLSWADLNSDALSWVVGGQDRHTVLLDGYRVDCD